MKLFFGISLVVLLALSGLMWHLAPVPVQDGRTVLTYACPDFWAKHEQVALFNQLHKELRVVIDPGNTEMRKTIVQSLAHVGPDLFNAYSAAQVSAFVQAGIAWDITDELAKAGLDIRELTWPATHAYTIRDGRVYGFPYAAHTDALYFNKEIFERAGLPLPSGVLDREQFLDLAKRLTVRDANGRVKQFGFLFQWQHSWRDLIEQWGGRLYNADGTRCEIDCPENIAAVQFMADLIYKHQVSPSPEQESGMATAGGWGSGAVTWFGAGRGALALGGRYWLVALRQKQQYPNLRLGVVEYQFGPRRVYQGYGGSVMINRNSPRRQQALAYLLFMAGREYNELVNAQADGLAPVRQFAYTERFLHNPKYPEETANAVWRNVLERGQAHQISPFIDGAVEEQIITRQMDLIKSNVKPVAEGLRAAAAEINAVIQENLRRNPALRQRHANLVGQAATPTGDSP